MTKEELLRVLKSDESWDEIEFTFNRFFSQNVIIPKGENISNNFTDYGFEMPSFEGMIVAISDENYYIGYYIERYQCIIEPQKIPCFWNVKTGNCYKGAGVSNSKYSLCIKPSEPVWEWLHYNAKGDTFWLTIDEFMKDDGALPLFVATETKRERR